MLVAALLLGVAGCTVNAFVQQAIERASPDYVEPKYQDDSDTATAKYSQTWPKNYSDTTCTEWTQNMTEQQHFAAAADMLSAARSKDGSSDLPPDQLINQFQGDVAEGCSASPAAALAVAEVGASIYLIGRDQYSP